MKRVSHKVLVAGFALGIALASALVPVSAQQPPPAPSAAAIASAREILSLKNIHAIYDNAVPGVVQKTRDTLLQTNINYQKDLNEVAVIVAKNLAGREQDIGEGMARIYASEFTEQELKDLVAFYKSPLGQKLITNEPKAVQASMTFMNQWAQAFGEIVNGQFRAEMRKRGKDI